MTNTSIEIPGSDREIIITRTIDAPRTLVWEAFTDPKHLEKWWGPDGFTTRTEVFDFAVGGKWRHVMVGPDGAEYPNQSLFTEIVKHERISYEHGGGDGTAEDAIFDATITFEDLGDKTKITMHSVFQSKEYREHVVKRYGAIEGGKQHLANLENYVLTHLQ